MREQLGAGDRLVTELTGDHHCLLTPNTLGVTCQAAVVAAVVASDIGGSCLLVDAVHSLCCGGLIESRGHQGAAGRSDEEKRVRLLENL